jgi:hypothetical protein
MADLIEGVDVATAPYEGVEVVRAELTLAPGQSPGFLFGAVSRGSVVELIIGSRGPARRSTRIAGGRV